MADIFTKTDAHKVVKNRIIWFMGDSNTRSYYKDLVWLLQNNSLINMSSLRNKLEGSFMNDKLLKGKSITKARNYIEVRCFENKAIPTKIEFTFLTECLNDEIVNKLKTFSDGDTPDVIIVNSCLWDLTRWGPEGVVRYKKNVRDLLGLLKDYLPSKTLIIWTTTPPLSSEPQGGFLINQLNFMKPILRFDVMEANTFARDEVVKAGFDVLDVHYHLLLQIHRRRPDGIHWNPDAVRHVTNLLLTHMSLSFGMRLPGNFKSPLLEELILSKDEAKKCNNRKRSSLKNETNVKKPEVLKKTIAKKKKNKNKRFMNPRGCGQNGLNIASLFSSANISAMAELFNFTRNYGMY